MHPSDEVTGDINISGLEDATSSDIQADSTSELDLSEDELLVDDDEATGTLSNLEADLVPDTEELEDEISEVQPINKKQAIDDEVEVEVEYEEEEEEIDDESQVSPLQKIINEKLPFLKGIVDKVQAGLKKGKKSKESQDDDEELERTKTEFNPEALAELKGKDKLIAQIQEKVPALKGILSKLNKKKSNDDELDEDFDPNEVTPIKYADDEAEEKPKKKLKLIHIIIILGVLGVVFYEDIVPPEPEVAAPTIKPIPKNKVVPKKKADEPTSNVVNSEQGTGITPDRTAEQIKEVGTANPGDLSSDTEIPVETPPVVEQDPVEDKPVVQDSSPSEELDDLFDEQKPETPSSEVTNEVVESEPSTSDIDSSTSETSNDSIVTSSEDTSSEEGTGEVSSEVSSEDITTQVTTEEENPVADPSAKDSGLSLNDGQIDDQVVDGAGDNGLAKSILEDLEVKVQASKKDEKLQTNLRPVDAPSYEIPGRALIYNCAGKHWACIDSVSFKTCEQNYAWNSDQGKQIECYPVELYQSEEDCAHVQQKKIDGVAETGFCGI